MKSMTLPTLVAMALKDGGYDGLFLPETCACKLGDLMPCGEPSPNCEAGWLMPCDGSCDTGECDFHIGPSLAPHSSRNDHSESI